MFVSDLRHFLDMPDEAPGPAKAMAGHLFGIVQAATAAKSDEVWLSALTCRRRPSNQLCRGIHRRRATCGRSDRVAL